MTTPRTYRTPRTFLNSRRVQQQPKFKLEDFEIGSTLGEGKFSQVFIAREKKYGFYVALKSMHKPHLKSQNLQQQVHRQILLHSKYSHPNILTMYGYFHTNSMLYLILQLSDQGDLFTYFKQKKQKHLGEEESARYVRDVCYALRELHGDGVVHRDIKPQNVMLCNGKAKLGDFGLAAKVSSSKKRTTFCGTLDYLAPEMFEEHEHCEKVDVWSVGVLAYELNCGKAPFAGEQEKEVEKNIRNFQLKLPERFSEELKEFIRLALNKDQQERPSIEELLKARWLLIHNS